MNILIVNDDGYSAGGLVALADVLQNKGHDITVVAPARCYSGASHAMIFHKPMKFEKIEDYAWPCYSLEGNPADCVKLGLQHILLNETVDLLISGINNETNLGEEIQCSGTANAAVESANAGVLSIALSSEAKTAADYKYFAELFAANFDYLYDICLKASPINVNLSKIKDGKLKPKIVSMGKRNYHEYYIIDKKSDGILYTLTGYPIDGETPENGDVYWYDRGYTTITPMVRDRTDYKALDALLNGGF